MNSQNPNKKSTGSHGIRMIRGAVADVATNVKTELVQSTPQSSKLRVCVSEEKAASDAALAARKKLLRNPLLMQLNALANSLDDEIAQILKL